MKQKKWSTLMLPAAVLMLQFVPVTPSSAAEAPTACGELVQNKCTSCHYETRICQKLKKRTGKQRAWKKTMKSMIRHGAEVNKEEQKSLVACLSKPDKEIAELCGTNK